MFRKFWGIIALGCIAIVGSAFMVEAQEDLAPVQGFLPSGVLRERMELNDDRMNSYRYAPVEKSGSFREADYAWPGDMEGRALLAFVRLEKSLGRPSKHLGEFRKLWPQRLNAQGYFGKRLDPQAIDEQQLSGHGWVLRGLCELYQWKKEPAVLKEIQTIVQNLALPTKGAHALYPIDPQARVAKKGGVSGERIQKIGRWVLSTDIGCDMIFMDGVMQAATLLNDPAVDSLCEEILARYFEIDLAAIKAQTHASLTGLRGVLRWAEYKKRVDLIPEVEKRFQLYLREGITENEGNWNWFGRPTHTEPCAIVDSLMVAQQLWQSTQKPEYLAWVHRIVYNGFYHDQIANGGFGCSKVTGAAGNLFLSIDCEEAWFCCSMRGAEGFAELAQRSFYLGKSGESPTLFVTGLHPGELDLAPEGVPLRGRAFGGYPLEGRWSFVVESIPEISLRLSLFLPPWGEEPAVMLNGKPLESKMVNGFVRLPVKLKGGDCLSYHFRQKVTSAPLNNSFSAPGLIRYTYGPLVLGLPAGAPVVESIPPASQWRWQETAGCATAPGFDLPLSPLGERVFRSEPDLKSYRRQILFKK